MKISTKELRKALASCSCVTPTRTPDERLLYAKIQGDSITATDSQLFLKLKMNCEDPFKEPVLVQVATLKQIAGTTSSETIEINSSKSGVIVNCGKSRFSLPTMDPSRFPVSPTVAAAPIASVKEEVLREAVEMALPHIDEVSTTPGAAGVCFYFGPQGFRILAADHNGAAHYWVDNKPYAPVKEEQIQESISAKTARCLTTISGDVQIGLYAGGLYFQTESAMLLGPCIKGKLSIKLFEKNFDVMFSAREATTFNKADLLEGLSQVGIVLSESNGINLKCNGTLALSSTENGSEVAAEVPCQMPGPTWEAKFQQRLLTRATRVLDDQIAVKVSDVSQVYKAIEMKSGRKCAIVMSMVN